MEINRYSITAIASLVLLVLGCAQIRPSDRPPVSPAYCGGKMAVGALTQYLAKLNSAIAQGQIPSGLGPERTSKSPSFVDWQTISSAIEAGKLESVGWRGCILSNGKASFESDGAGTFALKTFDADRAWEL
jgi:hypothetical protein